MNPYARNLPAPAIIGFLALGLLLAIGMGVMTGMQNMRVIFGVCGATAAIAGVLFLKTKVWLLIPLCWFLTGKITMLPLPFSVRDLSVMVAALALIVLVALKQARLRREIGTLDFLVFLNFGWVCVTYLRNPVGVRAMGADMVGGKPYFDIGIGLIAFLILTKMVVDVKTARLLPIFLIFSAGIGSFLNLITQLFPFLVPVIAPFYSGVSIRQYLSAMESVESGGGGEQRFQALGSIGRVGGLALCSYFKPITLVLPVHPLRFFLFIAVCVAILLSGFRSAIVYFGIIFILSSYFQGGIKDIIKAGGIAFTLALFMIIAQGRFIELPHSAQRTLSFLPGEWSERAIRSGKGSSEWRFEMWRIVWAEERYIRNKILGDGFGFSAYEFNIMLGSQMGGRGFIGGAQQESAMIGGVFHSGPLSAIRFTGIVGFVLFMALLVYLAIRSWKLINLARGTSYFPLALFVGLPAIYQPFNYVFIFGAYNDAVPNALFAAGMIQLVSASLRSSGQITEKSESARALEYLNRPQPKLSL